MSDGEHDAAVERATFVARVLGGPPMGSGTVVVGDHEQSTVWRFDVAGRRVILKCHHHPPSALREVQAYRAWHPVVGDRLPRLLADDPARGWVLWSEVDGVRGDGLDTPSLHEAAGRFSRDLDDAKIEQPDPMALDEAWTHRWRRTSEDAAPWIGPTLRANCDAIFEPRVFQASERRWCHRDFMPYNWIWSAVDDGGGRLVVIDLGQARPDARPMDWVKLSLGPWCVRPDLRAAFERGRGADFDERELAQLRQAELLTLVGDVAFAGRRRSEVDTPLVRLRQWLASS